MKRTNDYEKKPSQTESFRNPITLNLQTRPFAPIQSEDETQVSGVQTKYTSSGDILQKLISTTPPEKRTPIRRNPFPRLRNQANAIQAKLNIGEPNDKYEQEADATAAQVVQQINSSPQEQSVQRSTEIEEEELQMKSLVQRRENLDGGEASSDLESSIQSARGSGKSLDADLQAKMGQAMGADFSGVKVHTDSQSDQLNQSIQAKAFTTGQDVFFRQGAYEPSSQGGQELIAHELTHVVQQNGGVLQQKSLNNTPEISHTGLQKQSNHPSTMIYLQRMPLSLDVRKDLGAPKKDGKRAFTGKVVPEGTKYKAVLKALQDYETYIGQNFVATDKPALRQQMVAVDKLLQDIYDAMSVYRGTKKKAKYMIRRKQEVLEQQDIVAQAFLKELDRDVPRDPNLVPSLNSIINLAQQNNAPVQLNENQKLGSMAGGSKTVGQYAFDNKEGYFKEDVKTLGLRGEDYGVWRSRIVDEVQEEGLQKGWKKNKIEQEITKRDNAINNEENVAIQAGGINPEDARLANRDIAMSRLDQLLGTKMIARAQFAVVTMGDGQTVQGSIMDSAKKNNTSSPKEHIEDQNLNPQQKTTAIGLDDPDFYRLTSRLHLIDLIANQVDRNNGNYFIERDVNGNIVNVTGIDNDMSFGNRELHTKKQARQALPGVSKFVDKEMAQIILSIEPQMLRIILQGLLSIEDVNAAVLRLEQLQNALQSATLLEPHEWITHLNQIKQEGRNYGDETEFVISRI